MAPPALPKLPAMSVAFFGGFDMRNYTPPDKTMLSLWVIYDRPTDFPQSFVARLWQLQNGQMVPRDQVQTHPKLEVLRNEFRKQGLTCIPRFTSDDPKIIEVWL